jgi:large subunit ribosomal protein L19
MTDEKEQNINNEKVVETDSAQTATQTEETQMPELRTGMTVRVYQKIKELNMKGEEKERVQYFEGIIIAKKHNKEVGGTITVRKNADGVGVEKIFPLNLPTISNIEVLKEARTRRSKLYFLKRGYKKKLKETHYKKNNKKQ